MASRIKDPHSWGRVGLRLGQLALFVHIFYKYVGGVHRTSGISMVPTIPAHFDGRPYVLFSCLHRRGRGVKVGDVIAYTHPIFPNEVGCKRIIGMPGDFVSVVTPGRRDEDVEAEDVDNRWASVKEQVIQVPEGHCWVAGDNLEWSRDSRLFGPLPLGLVKAKALAVAKPFKYGQWLGWFGGNWLDATWLGAKHDVKDAQEKEHEWTVPR